MASRLSFDSDLNQIIFEEKQNIRKIILNKPQQLNALTYEMVTQMKKALEAYEVDDTIKLLIFKGQGKAFCSGGDIGRYYQVATAGHWSLAARMYKKTLMLIHLISSYKKPLVMMMDGIVMGGGAGIALNGGFRIVTENTVFAMPEVFMGTFADVGISYYLSRLSGHYGEYLALTGTRIGGSEMLAHGLATHFILSKDLTSVENELKKMECMDGTSISKALQNHIHKPNLNLHNTFARLEIINKCFSKKTVEEILSSLEIEVGRCGEKWMEKAIKSMKSASPTGLNICLKAIREGRNLSLEECLKRDYVITSNELQGKFCRDLYEGMRAIFIDKDKKPKWNPQKLEEVSEEFVEQFFQNTTIEDDEDWDCLELPRHKSFIKTKFSKL